MTKPAIRVVNLSKEYHIGLKKPSDKTLREAIVDAAKGPFRRAAKLLSGQATGATEHHGIHQALSDVSFEVAHGEVIGVIGQNGAGKSTLMKILSRITEPTRGFAQIHGRVGSLLEVGTGFHQELTGRENIYLNGAILGMRKTEIVRKFDEIVTFAEMEKFLDTPVKHYSSGMYMRLAFSVAAHLEPEILLVDEVLSVGDVAFQKKCLGKMNEVQRSGRTVLFVSHNMATIENLCTRTIVLNEGKVAFSGPSKQAVEYYLQKIVDRRPLGDNGTSTSRWSDASHRNYRSKDEVIKYTGVEFRNPEKEPIQFIRSGDPLVIRLRYHASRDGVRPIFGIGIATENGTVVSQVSTWLCGVDLPALQSGDGFIDLHLDAVNLMPGRYFLSLWLGALGPTFYDSIERCSALEIEPADFYGSGRTSEDKRVIMLMPCRWEWSGLAESTESETLPAENVQSGGEGLLRS